MRLRILVSLIALLTSVPLSAQANEIGIFVNHPSFSDNSATVFAFFETAILKVDSKIGYGISFNHFLSRRLSLQVSGQTVRGNAKLEAVGGVHFTNPAGTLNLKQYDAVLLWNFVPEGPVRPYVGGGVAWVGGGRLQVADDAANGVYAAAVSLDSKLTWLVEGGVDFRISHNAAVTLAAKFTHYTSGGAINVGVSSDPNIVLFEPLKLDPMTINAGLRWRF
jgi:outer membrane protein W